MKYLGLRDEYWLSSDAAFPLNHAKDDAGSDNFLF